MNIINTIGILSKIAIRNVFRNKRRSFITSAAIAFGLAILIHLNGFNDGFNEQMINNVVRLQTGHIQISEAEFHQEIDTAKFISEPDRIIEDIYSANLTPYVKAVTKRVMFQALISSTRNSAGAMVVGISPKEERQVSVLERTIVKGGYLKEADSPSILIGERLAKNLSVDLGDKIVLLTQAYDGSMGARALRIRGIFRTGIPEIDRSTVYIPLNTAQKIAGYESEVSVIVVLLQKSQYLESIYRSLSLSLKDRGLEILTWKDLAPDMVEIIRINKVNIYIVMGIVFTLVAMGILNTMLMSVFERFREIGIIMTIGMRDRQIVLMILLESFFLAAIAGSIGVIIGLGDIWYLSKYGFDFSQFSHGIGRFLGINTIIYSMFTWKGILIPLLFVFSISIIAALYPALKAARLEIVDTLRHI